MTTNTTITPELLDQLLANYKKPEDLTGDDGLFKQLKKALIERALGAELTEHLGYEKGDPAGRGRGNSRNGSSSKTVLTEDGEVEIAVPRDRAGSFEPQLIAKGQTHFDGFDDKILSLYARGMTVPEIPKGTCMGINSAQIGFNVRKNRRERDGSLSLIVVQGDRGFR
jgi:transposase-like protein